MYKIPLAELKLKVVQSGKLTGTELEERIKVKINELSGLISEEGATHIIANELGIELISISQTKLKIKEIYGGMKNVSTVGKVVQKSEVREFAKGESKGRVCSVTVGDETGIIRVVFWNEQVDQLKTVNPDDILLVSDAYVRENNNAVEVHLGSQGSITINPPGEVIEVVRRGRSYERRKIEQLIQGEDNAEIVGTIVQVFDPRFFYVCPQCNRRVTEANSVFQCNEHGPVSAQ